MPEMTHAYCTLFDSGYLSRGLCMIDSLQQTTPDAVVVVFCFDEKALSILKELNKKNVTLVSLKDFEDPELLKVKPSRSRGEYCWTCTSSTLLYCLEKLGYESATYLDADLFFFSSPKAIFEENPSASVLLTEHRYTPRYDQFETSGKYCVQFMHFKKDERGLTALRWWRNACLEWCYARLEDGKFGDQKYLDDWMTRFQGVHEVQHIGAGVAPWNIQQYQIQPGPELIEQNGKRWPVIFYHFHALQLLQDGQIDLCHYELPKPAQENIYFPYLKHLLKAEKFLSEHFRFQSKRSTPISLWKKMRRKLSRQLNYVPAERITNVLA